MLGGLAHPPAVDEVEDAVLLGTTPEGLAELEDVSVGSGGPGTPKEGLEATQLEARRFVLSQHSQQLLVRRRQSSPVCLKRTREPAIPLRLPLIGTPIMA